jgi:hypothetical protein
MESTDGGSNYNVVKTTTNFSSNYMLKMIQFALCIEYQASADLAQGTNFARLNGN